MADKGLKSNVVGLFGGTMLGISSVAPAYALTATLRLLAASVGAKTPVVIRHQLFNDAFNLVFKFLFPLLGGLGLFFVLIITRRHSADPSYGSGASIGGVGLVLILGLGLILAGLVVMAILRVRQPAFFRGKTLRHESAHDMRPDEHLVS
jgi:hypothetical protein